MSKDIKINKKISLKHPVLLAGWPGMGNVAIGAMDYLRKQLRAEYFAEVNSLKYLMPESISVEKGLAYMPRPPRNYFYFVESPPIIFFESETQLAGESGLRLMESIIKFSKEMKVKRIYTGAAFSLPISHRDPSEVYGVSSAGSMMPLYKKYGIKPMEEGQISGLNGMLVGYAKEAGIEAMCLLATMPVYAVNFPNPKASMALINVLAKMINLRIDFKELGSSIVEMDKKMESIEQNLRELFPGRPQKREKKSDSSKKTPFEQGSKIPPHVLDKIERLFREAKLDREKAAVLKEELDRWNLYKLYEDRFLNLFKEKH